MIDTASIAGRGTKIRSLVKEVTVNAGSWDVWAAWASEEGIATWWNPPETRIDLRIGGPRAECFVAERRF